MAIAEDSVREMRSGEDWVSEWARKAFHRGMEAGNRRVERRWRCVTWAAIEWSERVFFVVISAERRAKGRAGKRGLATAAERVTH